MRVRARESANVFYKYFIYPKLAVVNCIVPHCRGVPDGQITLTEFALWGSEVVFDSEVHPVSEVSSGGKVDKTVILWYFIRINSFWVSNDE